MKKNKRDKHQHNPPYTNDPFCNNLRFTSEVGVRKWHRYFGWVTITKPYTKDGKTLVDSEYKFIQIFVQGKGWIDYKGTGENGNIVNICVHYSELYPTKQEDKKQSLIDLSKRILA